MLAALVRRSRESFEDLASTRRLGAPGGDEEITDEING
jgi:hypothetical protein